MLSRLVTTCIFIVFCGCSSVGSPSSHALENHLPSSAVTILAAPDEIHYYRMSPKSFIGEDLLGGYRVIADEGVVTSSALVEYLSESDNLSFSYIKKVRLYPEFGFAFVNGDERVLVLISITTRQVEFVYDDVRIMANCDTSIEPLKTILATIT
ncbi:MAG: hypothetical protein HN411_06625 [Waddliaceae bacterium]|jgi:hypothetical protein|nr:hypothetical protein [Waddliaceae bacterium]MBT3578444.1 hypothetical protein [Waddliaceae bacterium]MBT4445069.1 hypothetical protein [Waddliaceae bacterium]MBT6927910.1 hypothetical protein [Waddliaceae bacterium]MBT7264604.1 hypothetical protein [Waddliaceae bacterium]